MSSIIVSVSLLARLLSCLSDVTQCVAIVHIVSYASQVFQIFKGATGGGLAMNLETNRTHWQKHPHLTPTPTPHPTFARTFTNFQPPCTKMSQLCSAAEQRLIQPVLSLHLGGKLQNISGQDSHCRDLMSEGQKVIRFK